MDRKTDWMATKDRKEENFRNNFFFWGGGVISSDSCHKKMLVESLTIPLSQNGVLLLDLLSVLCKFPINVAKYACRVSNLGFIHIYGSSCSNVKKIFYPLRTCS